LTVSGDNNKLQSKTNQRVNVEDYQYKGRGLLKKKILWNQKKKLEKA